MYSFSIGFGQPSINGGLLPECTAHNMQNADPPISWKGFLRLSTSHNIIPQLNTSHFSVYFVAEIQNYKILNFTGWKYKNSINFSKMFLKCNHQLIPPSTVALPDLNTEIWINQEKNEIQTISKILTRSKTDTMMVKWLLSHSTSHFFICSTKTPTCNEAYL